MTVAEPNPAANADADSAAPSPELPATPVPAEPAPALDAQAADAPQPAPTEASASTPSAAPPSAAAPAPLLPAAMEKDYKVKLDVFEGPLDLLLFLIRRDEIDIYDIPIERITRQYLEYLELFERLNLDVAGEFIVMAANLIYIKSRSLLPLQQRADEADGDEADPRWELVRQLLEYKKFKEAAAHLGERESQQAALYGHSPEAPEAPAERPLEEVSVLDLIHAFQKILKRLNKKEIVREIFEEHFSVSDKIEHVLRLVTDRRKFLFSELFLGASSRSEVVVTFLALLELVRLKQLVVSQADLFGEIELTRREEGEAGQESPDDASAEGRGEGPANDDFPPGTPTLPFGEEDGEADANAATLTEPVATHEAQSRDTGA